MSSSKSFKLDWDKASKLFDELVKANPLLFANARFAVDASVMQAQRTGMVLESFYWFMRESEFVFRFQYEPKVLGFRLFVIKDEQGLKNLSGVLVRPVAGEMLYQYRIVRFYSESILVLEETHVDGSRRLRETQPNDIFEAKKTSQTKSYKMDRDVFVCQSPMLA
jgi:hypothetical protein